MAQTVGSVGCDLLRGVVEELKERVEVWNRVGFTGYGSHKLGDGESPFRFTAVEHDTSANLQTWFLALEALQGTIVSITDDLADTYTDMLITQVRRISKQRAIHANGGYRAEARILGVKLA